MFWRGITGFAHIGTRCLPKIVQRRGFLQFAAVLNRGARYFASEAIPNNEISTLRLWSDGGGEEVDERLNTGMAPTCNWMIKIVIS